MWSPNWALSCDGWQQSSKHFHNNNPARDDFNQSNKGSLNTAEPFFSHWVPALFVSCTPTRHTCTHLVLSAEIRRTINDTNSSGMCTIVQSLIDLWPRTSLVSLEIILLYLAVITIIVSFHEAQQSPWWAELLHLLILTSGLILKSSFLFDLKMLNVHWPVQQLVSSLTDDKKVTHAPVDGVVGLL